MCILVSVFCKNECSFPVFDAVISFLFHFFVRLYHFRHVYFAIFISLLLATPVWLTGFWKKGRRFYSSKSVWKLTKKSNIHFKRLCYCVLMKRAKLWTEYWTLDFISWALSHTLFLEVHSQISFTITIFCMMCVCECFLFFSRCARCAFNESLLWYWIHDSICFMPFHLAKMKWTRTKKENIEPKK